MSYNNNQNRGNEVATTPQMEMKKLLGNKGVERNFEYILGKEGLLYIKQVQSMFNNTPALWKCDLNSVVQCAQDAATQGLSVAPQYGYAAIIPYGSKAQLQIMVNGWRHLAISRGGASAVITRPVYNTDIITRDELTGNIIVKFNTAPLNPLSDASKIQKVDYSLAGVIKAGIVGYNCVVLFKDGRTPARLFMTIQECYTHGMTYSKTFGSSDGLWNRNFNAMAMKTVTKKCIKENVDIESFASAFEVDQIVHDGTEGDKGSYEDNPNTRTEETAPERRNPTMEEVLDKVAANASDAEVSKVEDADIPPEGIEVPDGPAPNPDAEPKWNPETGDFEY